MKKVVVIVVIVILAIAAFFGIKGFVLEDTKETSRQGAKEVTSDTTEVDIGQNMTVAITETNKNKNQNKEYDLNTVDTNKVIVDDEIRENVKMTVIEESISRDSVSVLITYPNDNKYNWGNEYKVYKKIGEEWTELERKHFVARPLSNVSSDDELNQLEKTFNYADVYDPLEDGIYIVSTNVFVNYNKEVEIFSNEFEIK